MPSTWQMYGVDANNDGRKDPYNPVDAICAAARYLKAAGGDTDLRTVDLRLQPRRLVRRRGPALREPVRQAPRGRWSARSPGSPRAPTSRSPPTPATPTTSPSAQALKRAKPGKRPRRQRRRRRSQARPHVEGSTSTPTRAPRWSRSTTASSPRSASRRSSASYIVLRDAYGNRFTYARARRRLRRSTRCRSPSTLSANDFKLVSPHADDTAPDVPATDGKQVAAKADAAQGRQAVRRRGRRRRGGRSNTEDSRDRLFAFPERKHNVDRAGPLRPARLAAREEDARLRVVQGLLLERPALRPEDDGAAAAQGGLAGDRGHRARRDRQDRRARPARPLLDPPGRPRRAEDRPEADPRRLEAARGDGDLPRRRPGPVHAAPPRPARCC